MLGTEKVDPTISDDRSNGLFQDDNRITADIGIAVIQRSSEDVRDIDSDTTLTNSKRITDESFFTHLVSLAPNVSSREAAVDKVSAKREPSFRGDREESARFLAGLDPK